MQNYNNLAVWRKAHALLLNIHREIRGFPREFHNLRGQLRRSAESIPNNIVEGCGRESQKELANYIQNAISSANEVQYQLRQALDYGIMKPGAWNRLTSDVCEVRRMLYGFRKRVRADIETDAIARSLGKQTPVRSQRRHTEASDTALDGAPESVPGS
jgi:four helix bundle protein